MFVSQIVLWYLFSGTYGRYFVFIFYVFCYESSHSVLQACNAQRASFRSRRPRNRRDESATAPSHVMHRSNRSRIRRQAATHLEMLCLCRARLSACSKSGRTSLLVSFKSRILIFKSPEVQFNNLKICQILSVSFSWGLGSVCAAISSWPRGFGRVNPVGYKW